MNLSFLYGLVVGAGIGLIFVIGLACLMRSSQISRDEEAQRRASNRY